MDAVFDFLNDADFECVPIDDEYSCDLCDKVITLPFYNDTCSDAQTCPDCFIEWSVGKSSAKTFEFLDGKYGYVVPGACYEPVIVNVDKQRLKVSPEDIVSQCTLERAQEWKRLAESLVEVEPSPLKFGSLRQWCLPK